MIRHPTFTPNGVMYGFFDRHLGHNNLGATESNTPAPPIKVRKSAALVALEGQRGTHAEGGPVVMAELQQVHGPVCHYISAPPPELLPGDALVTDVPHLALKIITADCVPVLFATQDGAVIGAAHAGWRGAVGGILESTLQVMVARGADLSTIHAVIGPCIRQSSYEVGPEVRDAIVGRDHLFVPHATTPSRWWFDLPGLVKERLQGASVQYIHDTDRNTYTDPHTYFSYRRLCHQHTLENRPPTDCQLTVIMRQP